MFKDDKNQIKLLNQLNSIFEENAQGVILISNDEIKEKNLFI